MKETGLPCKPWEIKAFLDGRKTAVVRPVRSRIPDGACLVAYNYPDYNVEWYQGKVSYFIPEIGDFWPCNPEDAFDAPYGTIGDLIFMKETWAEIWDVENYGFPDFPHIKTSTDEHMRSYIAWRSSVSLDFFWVDGDGAMDENHSHWRSSIHMPKSAARIWREIIDIRVKRVQELSEEEILSIGIRDRENFRHLWQSDYGTWDQDPYVWIYDLKRVER